MHSKKVSALAGEKSILSADFLLITLFSLLGLGLPTRIHIAVWDYFCRWKPTWKHIVFDPVNVS